MAKLVLNASPDRVLPVELPDGSEVELKLRRLTLKESQAYDARLKAVRDAYESGELDSFEFMHETISFMVSNWNEVKDQIVDSGIELGHVQMIMETLKELQGTKAEDEKKSP